MVYFARTLFTVLMAVCTTIGSAASDSNLRIMSWNVHWQCGSDHIQGCRADAIKRFVTLAHDNAVNVLVSVELEANGTTPINLPTQGLHGWSQVNGSCAPPTPEQSGDVAAVSLAPGFKVLASDGGCLGGQDAWWGQKADARAFAVALVEPPSPVAGCPKGLCIIGLHAPHNNITLGQDKVQRVCGEARHGCTVASGDWNAPVTTPSIINPVQWDVTTLWARLLGNMTTPLVALPNENTCCYPAYRYLGWDDHVVSDIPGAVAAGVKVLPYQMKVGDTEEHMPILVNLSLPEATVTHL